MKLARVELFIIPVFIFFKYIRPTVLKSQAPQFFKIALYSLPNFFEAVIGTLTLTGVFLLINDKLNHKHQIRPSFIYLIAVLFTGGYVFAQEFKLIQTRTNMTFDLNDVYFSAFGLFIGYCIVLNIKPRIYS